VNNDKSGLVFGAWESTDEDVSLNLTNRMVGINCAGVDYNYNMNKLEGFSINSGDTLLVQVDTNENYVKF